MLNIFFYYYLIYTFFQFKNAVTPQWIWDCYDAKKILPLI